MCLVVFGCVCGDVCDCVCLIAQVFMIMGVDCVLPCVCDVWPCVFVASM